MKEHREQIKIAWRATFETPKWDRIAATMKGPIEVEVRKANGTWKAFRPGTRTEFPIAGQPQAATLKQQIEGLLFQRKVTDWQAWELNPFGEMRPLAPGSFSIDDQERAWRTLK